MLVIGSKALSYYVEGIVPNDLDLVGTYEEAVEFKKAFKAVSFYPIDGGRSIKMTDATGFICEVEIAWPDTRAKRLLEFAYTEDFPRAEVERGVLEGFHVPSPDLLYLLKMSHRYLKNSPHFLKTMDDIRRMRRTGCVIRPQHEEFYKQRMKDTYIYSHPKLDTSKGAFFDTTQTGVYQVYDHDSIHVAVAAVVHTPAYTFYQPDNQEVNCSQKMFEQCDHILKVWGVMEEALVLALERSLIPHPGKKTPEEAFQFALMKVCTSITSGWFREFAWEHYDEVLEQFHQFQCNQCFTEDFAQGVHDGIVKLKEMPQAA